MTTSGSNEFLNDVLKRAEQGDAHAQFIAGQHYRRGICVPKDLIRAASWFEEAAILNHSESQYVLAHCYMTGEGVPMSWTQAIFWWRKAAELGHGEALARLGICYERGEGVERDPVEAYAYYKVAESIIQLHPLLIDNLLDMMSEDEIRSGKKRALQLLKKYGKGKNRQ